MPVPSLDADVWGLILGHLVRPLPPPHERCAWADLHQHDLATVMRVSSTLHEAASPHLYTTVTTNDLNLLFRGMSRGTTYDSIYHEMEVMSGPGGALLSQVVTGVAGEDDSFEDSDDEEGKEDQTGSFLQAVMEASAGGVLTIPSPATSRSSSPITKYKSKLELLSLVKTLHVVHKPRLLDYTFREVIRSGKWDYVAADGPTYKKLITKRFKQFMQGALGVQEALREFNNLATHLGRSPLSHLQRLSFGSRDIGHDWENIETRCRGPEATEVDMGMMKTIDNIKETCSRFVDITRPRFFCQAGAGGPLSLSHYNPLCVPFASKPLPTVVLHTKTGVAGIPILLGTVNRVCHEPSLEHWQEDVDPETGLFPSLQTGMMFAPVASLRPFRLSGRGLDGTTIEVYGPRLSPSDFDDTLHEAPDADLPVKLLGKSWTEFMESSAKYRAWADRLVVRGLKATPTCEACGFRYSVEETVSAESDNWTDDESREWTDDEERYDLGEYWCESHGMYHPVDGMY